MIIALGLARENYMTLDWVAGLTISLYRMAGVIAHRLPGFSLPADASILNTYIQRHVDGNMVILYLESLVCFINQSQSMKLG